MQGNSDYYFQQMNKISQQAYYAMLEGLNALAPSFSVPRLEGRELADIYFRLRMDHPEIFYTVSFTYRFYPNAENAELKPEYIFERRKIPDHRKALDTRLRKLADRAKDLDEKGKEKYIHDFICENVTYDKLKKPYSHEIIGPLENGVGVCEGIAKTVKALCDRLGIWCIIALSEADPAKNIKYRHAWNVIRIGGKYYHLDATFDNSLGTAEVIRYDYFNLCDRQFYRDHQPVIWKVPECADGSASWYQTEKLSFTKYEDVEKRAAQAARKGKPLIFHWRGGYLTRDVLQELLRLCAEAAAKKGKVPDVMLNWPQAVLEVHFAEPEQSAAEQKQTSAEPGKSAPEEIPEGIILQQADREESE